MGVSLTPSKARRGRWWVDAVWFPYVDGSAVEDSGVNLTSRFPIAGERIVLCEAKHREVTPGLIGQALMYGAVARRVGAVVERTVIFADSGAPDICPAGGDLGLDVITSMSSAQDASDLPN
jgi:hypothetical protein